MIRISLIIMALCCLMLLRSPLEGYVARPVIAAVMSSDQPRYQEAHRAFVKSLAARGYPLSTTEIILKKPLPDPLAWSAAIKKINSYKPSLIVAYGAPVAMVAIRESDGIPVVSADIYTAEIPQPGMCGVSSRVSITTLLKTLQEIRPYSRIGILYTAREIGSHRQFEELKRSAAQYGMTVTEANVTSAAALNAALSQLVDKVDVIALTESSVASLNFDTVLNRANARNIPLISTMPDAAERGALLSLEINPQEQGHLAADIATRILEGAAPKHLPLLNPRRSDMVINMRIAREMGITLPYPVIGRATRVIK